MPDSAIDNDAPTQPIGQVIIPEEAPPAKPWKTVALGALLGAMLALGGLALSRFMLSEGGPSFVSWIGMKIHDDLVGKKVGKVLERAYGGPDAVMQINAAIKPAVALGLTALGGLALGALGGLLLVLLRRGRLVPIGLIMGTLVGLAVALAEGSRSVKLRVLSCIALTLLGALALLVLRRFTSPKDSEDEPRIPAALPLGLAVAGIFTNGFVWGNAAVMLLPWARRHRGLAIATWIVGAAAVLLWACASES
jgi:hypothetical protein